ncbi:AbrB/MazE/SpoVT family DNA-binding domain-containing protein [Paenibacillus alvei]|uniref:AbrB/MazE/SpoVT family DNA-binding domain-containing protein n=1 Tax=Paenibacillus alvei TaxID=44250 RepID=A0ABT4H4L4_PAEAL|nr:AbrB/MazE/SpoVT family DNA-binding domain-containing protein [Paenibacillus alvei]MCY9763927.1 AbrB/MazE/SpoVT family DNA-binding domain-containing protein [Paenibacillus alvei]MCY9771357.1 AbrB/MazE/SpoVT family DNA-binding domain-containing protein [Paenibacillus alvei]
MKSTGIVRRIDELGRLVIPMELRRTMGISEKEQMEIFTDGSRIIIQKYETCCTFCGTSEEVKEFRKKTVCTRCIKGLHEV